MGLCHAQSELIIFHYWGKTILNTQCPVNYVFLQSLCGNRHCGPVWVPLVLSPAKQREEVLLDGLSLASESFLTHVLSSVLCWILEVGIFCRSPGFSPWSAALPSLVLWTLVTLAALDSQSHLFNWEDNQGSLCSLISPSLHQGMEILSRQLPGSPHLFPKFQNHCPLLSDVLCLENKFFPP